MPLMLLEPQTTAWDWRWRFFGIPVRVHPMFWVAALIMGQQTLKQGPGYLVGWIACFFVSILIHELGHVFMGMYFGTHSQVVLYAFGGLAIGSNRLNNRWQRGAILGLMWLRNAEDGAVYLTVASTQLGFAFPRDDQIAVHYLELIAKRPLEFAIVSDLIFINLLWGLINLLPVWPLDGGQVCRDVCEMVSPDRGLVTSLTISVATAGFLAVCAGLGMAGREILPFHFGSIFTLILFGGLAYQSYEELQRAKTHDGWLDDHWGR
jgi:stage IV sporulation protein FB